jgi:hypothetical protein
MPSVFTIQGLPEEKPNKRDLDKLCDIRAFLMSKAVHSKHYTPTMRKYQTAADIVQQHIEDRPGGREYFWSGRCGTKKRRR